VDVIPAHQDLDRVVEIGQALVTRHEHAPPDRRADFQEEDVKLVDHLRSFFFFHYLFPFILLSAWKLLDTLFELSGTGQGITHRGRNSRRTIFGLMAHIHGDFFQ
jgi:hypothetical protein